MRMLDIINEDVNEGPIDWALAKMCNQKAKVKQSDSSEVKRQKRVTEPLLHFWQSILVLPGFRLLNKR